MKAPLGAVIGVSLIASTGCTLVAEPAPALLVEPYQFTAADGRTVEAELGHFSVPENRSDPDSRSIELAFVRFPSTSDTPGDPIVYLAGGPGGSGSGTARGARFDIFMALRAEADVIAFDQRGTGLSQSLPDCIDETPPSASTPLTHDNFVPYIREQTARCLAWWREQGIDIDAYNTAESAADIEDLRRAIDADQINLWAISYGTHLGTAYLREHDDAVARAVFAGFEGPDETVKLPSQTDMLLERIAAMVAADPEAGAVYPDLVGMMRRVLDRLENEPVEVTITPEGSEAPVTMHIGAFPIQIITGSLLSDPASISRIPVFYLAMDNNQFDRVATIIHQQLFADPARMRAMSTAMDMASGITDERLVRVEREAETSVLGDALNYPMPHLVGVAPELDLGDDFRAPLVASTPILFISGTLDGRTYPDSARAALQYLPNARQLIVENGGHNIYEADPHMIEVVRDWFRDGEAPDHITFDPPQFIVPR